MRQFVNKENFDSIKMHGTNVKKKLFLILSYNLNWDLMIPLVTPGAGLAESEWPVSITVMNTQTVSGAHPACYLWGSGNTSLEVLFHFSCVCLALSLVAVCSYHVQRSVNKKRKYAKTQGAGIAQSV